MKESIFIENFGGLKKVEIELNKINILIGPQASGKSITAKLFYFFKGFIPSISKSVEEGLTKPQIDKNFKEKFLNYFPIEAWPTGYFKIQYGIDDDFIKIERQSNDRLKLSYSGGIIDIIKKSRKIYGDLIKRKMLEEPEAHRGGYFRYKLRKEMNHKFDDLVINTISRNAASFQYFIPAGRSFFANIQSSIFSFLSNNKSIDPFLIEFGSFYENFKDFGIINSAFKDKKMEKEYSAIISEIISGNFKREKEKDFIIHKDSRKVNLAKASSGQQETLPLMIILKYLTGITSNRHGSTLYIEEPEAHLFPNAQKRIVQLLARSFNAKNCNFQIIVTTHSPYILSAFNNLIQAGRIISEFPEKKNEVYEVVNEHECLNPEDFKAYSIFQGVKKNLVDDSTGLIAENVLDSVSDEISIEFGKLLDIEY